ncbi:MAG: Ig-like domain-containing protein, partial [bacterium]|nr:Ig-like domain-containing protein [bacterium]
MWPKKRVSGWIGPVLIAGTFLLTTGCSSGGPDSSKAAPSFCPGYYADTLPEPLAIGNSLPRAYYRQLFTQLDTPLDIDMLACDPDQSSSDGLHWEVAVPPLWDGPPPPPWHGNLSAYRGTYPEGGVVTYTPDQGYVGTDSFTYHVGDQEAWGNTAIVHVTVTLPQVTSPQLYFGGDDDARMFHLWSYDGINPIQTVPGSAQGTSAIGIKQALRGQPYQDRIYFIGTDASFEANFLFSFDPYLGQYSFITEGAAAGDMLVHDGLLYVSTFAGTGGTPSFLWSTNGSGSWNSVTGTVAMSPNYLTSYNGKIYFSGFQGQGRQLWSYDPVMQSLNQETNISVETALSPRDLTVCNGRIYFAGWYGAAAPYEYLWSYDETSPADTVTNTVTSPYNMICYDNELYFTAMGAPGSTAPAQLWSVSAAGAFTKWTDNAVAPFTVSGSETYPAILDGNLYLRGSDDNYTSWIWSHDGASPLTTVAGSDNLYPFETTPFDGRLFFYSSNLGGQTTGNHLGVYDPVQGT